MKLEVITQRPTGTSRLTPILFVHGAWHAAWCWEEHFMPYFAEHQYVVHALSLRGHGGSWQMKSMLQTGIHDYVMDVSRVANEIEANAGVRPVVIGHSMGGYLVQKYLETHTAPAAVLLASLPVMGTLPSILRTIQRYPFAALLQLLQLRNYPIVANPKRAHELFHSSDMPRDEVLQYTSRITPESVPMMFQASFSELPNPARINPTSMLIVAAEKDQVFTVEEERKTAQAYRADFELIPNTAHDAMLDPNWQHVADTIIGWLGKQGI